MVIALACRNLPPRQRSAGIAWGVAAVIVLRVALTAFAVALLELPFLRLAGAVLLLWVGIALVARDDPGSREVRGDGRLPGAVGTIVAADLAMSFDNVLAVAAVQPGALALVLGLAVSIPLVVAASGLIVAAVVRFPLLVVAGGGLLGWLAGGLASADAAVKPWIDATLPQLHLAAPVAGALVVVAVGGWSTLRRRGVAGARSA